MIYKGDKYEDPEDQRIWVVKNISLGIHNISLKCADGSDWLCCFDPNCKDYEAGSLQRLNE